MAPSAPKSQQIVHFLVAASTGAVLSLSGLTLTGTFVTMMLATPLLVLCSPILVPAGIVISLATAGFIFSVGCGVVGMTALSSICNHLAGITNACLNWSEQVDYPRHKSRQQVEEQKKAKVQEQEKKKVHEEQEKEKVQEEQEKEKVQEEQEEEKVPEEQNKAVEQEEQEEEKVPEEQNKAVEVTQSS